MPVEVLTRPSRLGRRESGPESIRASGSSRAWPSDAHRRRSTGEIRVAVPYGQALNFQRVTCHLEETCSFL